MTQKINITAIIIVLVLVIGSLIGLSIYNNQDSGKMISVTGNSQITVAPDSAVVYLLVQTRDLSAQTAKDENARITDDVLTALIKTNIERKDIQTESYSINPEYTWTNQRQEIKGYVASNYIRVTTTDFNNVGKIVDASVNAGALVNWINFELSTEKSNEYKKTVLTNASKDAEAKATAIATGLGKKLGDVVSVSSSDYNYYPYRYYENMALSDSSMEMKTAATSIQPKDLDISAMVSVSYKIR
jgi:hypothetical protein